MNTADGIKRILLAEDDGKMRTLLSRLLRRDGYEVLEADDGIGLCDYIDDYRDDNDPFPPSALFSEIDLIVSDIRMPYITGMQVLRELCKRGGAPPVILITAFGSEETHAEALALGALAVFDKPFDIELFCAFVRKVLPLPTNAQGAP